MLESKTSIWIRIKTNSYDYRKSISFPKIRLRYARNVVMYGLPESIDTITDCLALVFDSKNWKPILNSKLNAIKLHKEMTQNEKIELTK